MSNVLLTYVGRLYLQLRLFGEKGSKEAMNSGLGRLQNTQIEHARLYGAVLFFARPHTDCNLVY